MVSNTIQCEFESHPGHRSAPSGDATAARRQDRSRLVTSGPSPRSYIDLMRPGRAIAAVGAALLASALTASCSLGGGGSDDDDTRTAVDPAEGAGPRAKCVVADPQGEVILHPGSLAVDVPTRVVSVALVDAVGLDPVEEAVVDYSGAAGVQGVILDYPPLEHAGLVDSLADWDSRRPLVGARLRPADGEQAVLVAVRLADADSSGRVRGVRLTLRTRGGGSRTVPWEQLVLVQPPEQLCTVEVVASTTEWTR